MDLDGPGVEGASRDLVEYREKSRSKAPTCSSIGTTKYYTLQITFLLYLIFS